MTQREACVLCAKPLMASRDNAMFCGDCTGAAHRVRRWAKRHGQTYEEAVEHFQRTCRDCGASMIHQQPQMIRCSRCTGGTPTSMSLPDAADVNDDWPRCQECSAVVHDRRARFCRPCRRDADRIYQWGCRNGVTYAEARAMFHRPCPICQRSMVTEWPTARACRNCASTTHGKRALSIAQRYGLDVPEALRLLTIEDCQICGMHLPLSFGKHRHIDHDHATGQVRGVLCHWCNLMLGSAKDRPELLRSAATYLEAQSQP